MCSTHFKLSCRIILALPTFNSFVQFLFAQIPVQSAWGGSYWGSLDLFLNNQPDTQIIQILFCYKTLHILGIFSAHHQEFSTVHSALVSFMQVSDDHFQAESGWNCLHLPEIYYDAW
jgi:hypothetical protein